MKNMWLGFIAAFFSAVSMVPTIYNTTIKKSTHSISYLYLVLTAIAQIIWIFYGVMNMDIPLIILGFYLLFILGIITYSKWYYEREEKIYTLR
jgi:uncharacterized protein with PQ loop repeat